MPIYTGKNVDKNLAKKLANPKTKEKKFVLVPPHKRVSRFVLDEDFNLVFPEVKKMRDLMENLIRDRIFKQVFAVAHPQIESETPLRFFVLSHEDQLIKENNRFGFESHVIINPEIVRHSSTKSIREEGCLWAPMLGIIKYPRWHKIELKYFTFGMDDKLHEHNLSLSGLGAQIVQHEIDHFDGIFIYQEMFDRAEKEAKKFKGVKKTMEYMDEVIK